MAKAKQKTPAREGKTVIAGHFDPKVSVQLKLIGLEQGERSVQDLMAEALNLLFERYGKKAIAK